MSHILHHEGPRQRQPRKKDKDYLAWIASLGGPQGTGCVICQRSPCEVAHVRYSEACPRCSGAGTFLDCTACGFTGNRYAKRPTGMGEKPDDIWTLPLCPLHHRTGRYSQHSVGDERGWWEFHSIDPLALCKALQEVYPDFEKGVAVLGKFTERL